MKMEITRNSISIIPESEIDKAYIEEVLGLKSEEDQAIVERINIYYTFFLAYIKISKRKEPK